jgi:hypothetical protein
MAQGEWIIAAWMTTVCGLRVGLGQTDECLAWIAQIQTQLARNAREAHAGEEAGSCHRRCGTDGGWRVFCCSW